MESRARTRAQTIPNSKLHRETRVYGILGSLGSHSSGVLVEEEEFDGECGERYSKTLLNFKTSIKNKHLGLLSRSVVFFYDNIWLRVASAVDFFFFRLIDHQLNQSLKNRFFSIFGIFDHV